ncbi:MAG: hypothetical protein Q9212_005102 [Teloschistes hypoglaucus]
MTRIVLSPSHLAGKGAPVDTSTSKPTVNDKATPDKKSLPDKNPFPTQKPRQKKRVASPTKVITSLQSEHPIWRFRLRSNNSLLNYFSLLTFVCFFQHVFPFHMNNNNEIKNPTFKLIVIWIAGFLWWVYACTFDCLNRVADQYFPHSRILTRSTKTEVVSGRGTAADGSIMAKARTLLHTLDHFVHHYYRVSSFFIIMLEYLAQVWVFNFPLWKSKIPEVGLLQLNLRMVLVIAISLHTFETMRKAIYQHKDNTHGAIKNQAPHSSHKDPKAPAQKKRDDGAAKKLRMNKAVEKPNREIELKILREELDEIYRQRSLLERGNFRLSRSYMEEQRSVMKAKRKTPSAELVEMLAGIERALEAEMGGLAPVVD